MDTQPFADRLHDRIRQTKSWLVAGLDPVLEDLPPFILASPSASTTSISATLDDRIENALVTFYSVALEAIGGMVAAIKPNLAFFEQYGIAGLKAFQRITSHARSQSIPIIADAKRGDIGTTAQAYSNAFLGRTSAFGEKIAPFEADALTVNPFLGFDTLEVFLKDCAQHGKGLFVLVKTSNPGSGDIQDLRSSDGVHVSLKVAQWIHKNASKLVGKNGLSGLGAVVGATYPQELAALRQAMPTSFFLIPGLGAQGGKASDTVAGFTAQSGTHSGAVVNVSRGLFGKLPAAVNDAASLKRELMNRASQFNTEIAAALSISAGK